MLAECLSEQGEWTQVMPGARACLFSLREKTFPLPLRLESLHFEVLFCLAGRNHPDSTGWYSSAARYPAGASPHRHL